MFSIYNLAALVHIEEPDDVLFREKDEPPSSAQVFQYIAFVMFSFLLALGLMNIFVGIMSSAFDFHQDSVADIFLRCRAKRCLDAAMCQEGLEFALRPLFGRRSKSTQTEWDDGNVLWTCYIRGDEEGDTFCQDTDLSLRRSLKRERAHIVAAVNDVAEQVKEVAEEVKAVGVEMTKVKDDMSNVKQQLEYPKGFPPPTRLARLHPPRQFGEDAQKVEGGTGKMAAGEEERAPTDGTVDGGQAPHTQHEGLPPPTEIVQPEATSTESLGEAAEPAGGRDGTPRCQGDPRSDAAPAAPPAPAPQPEARGPRQDPLPEAAVVPPGSGQEPPVQRHGVSDTTPHPARAPKELGDRGMGGGPEAAQSDTRAGFAPETRSTSHDGDLPGAVPEADPPSPADPPLPRWAKPPQQQSQ